MSFISSFIDLIFPRSCVSCSSIVERSPYRFLCTACQTHWAWIDEKCHCCQCGAPIPGDVEAGKICNQCQTAQPHFDQGRSLFHLDGVARHWVHTLKYRAGTYLKQDIGLLIKQRPELLSFLSGAYLVPVPLHPRKQRERGFNQSLLIAKELRRFVSGVDLINCLQRTVDTESQTCLNRESRIKNMKNAFAIRPKTVINPSFRYVIVDDVFTTGATLDACSLMLKHAGARHVDIFTLAHG